MGIGIQEGLGFPYMEMAPLARRWLPTGLYPYRLPLSLLMVITAHHGHCHHHLLTATLLLIVTHCHLASPLLLIAHCFVANSEYQLQKKSDPPPKTYLSIWSTPCSPFMVIPPPPLAHCCTNTLFHSLFSHICAHHSLSYILLTILNVCLSFPVIVIVTTTAQLLIVTHHHCSLSPLLSPVSLYAHRNAVHSLFLLLEFTLALLAHCHTRTTRVRR